LNIRWVTTFLMIGLNSQKCYFHGVSPSTYKSLTLYLDCDRLFSQSYHSYVGMDKKYTLQRFFFHKPHWFSICGGKWHRPRICLFLSMTWAKDSPLRESPLLKPFKGIQDIPLETLSWKSRILQRSKTKMSGKTKTSWKDQDL
jgi:hypothetical protein